MSLDVYLYGPSERIECSCSECGHMHNRICEPCLFSANITHNLGPMAREAGIYTACWRPNELMDVMKAAEIHRLEDAKRYDEAYALGETLPTAHARNISALLQTGLAQLLAEPARFKALNPENGWGTYDGFVPWVQRYLEACLEHPDATVSACR